MVSKTSLRLRATALAVPVGFLALAIAAKAVDPTLDDVGDLFGPLVTAILGFAVGVIGAFATAMLVPAGLKKVIAWARKLIGKS